jgi:hypothetical protein
MLEEHSIDEFRLFSKDSVTLTIISDLSIIIS